MGNHGPLLARGDLYPVSLDGYLPSRAPVTVPRLPSRKVKSRDLGPTGVRETNHTSYRLHWEDKERLRQIAEHMSLDLQKELPGEAATVVTMSAALRVLIRQKADELGIVVGTSK